MSFDMLIGATSSYGPLLSEVRTMTPFGRWEPVSQVAEEYWILLNHQKSYGPV